MIKNERQYRITKAQAAKFEEAIAADRAAPPAKDIHPELRKLSIDAARAQLETLREELAAYEALKTAKGKRSLSVSFEQLGSLFIQARIARGWSQRGLGEKLGLKMQQIQQYEDTFYQAASLTRLQEVSQALGMDTTVTTRLVKLPNLEEFSASKVAAKRHKR